jgi:hypothetical protein
MKVSILFVREEVVDSQMGSSKGVQKIAVSWSGRSAHEPKVNMKKIGILSLSPSLLLSHPLETFSSHYKMPFLMNRVILSALANIDLLAMLTLTSAQQAFVILF